MGWHEDLFGRAGAVGVVWQSPSLQLFQPTPRAELEASLGTGVADRSAHRRIDQWLERFGLTKVADRPTRELCGGDRTLTALSAAMMRQLGDVFEGDFFDF